MLRHRAPRLQAVPVLTPDKRLTREALVALRVQMFLIIIACHIQRIQEAEPCGKLRKRGSECHRTRRIRTSHNCCKICCKRRKSACIRAQRIVLPLFCRFIRVIITRHHLEGGMTVRIVRIIDLISDTPHHDGRMVPVPADQVGQIPLMPLWEIHVIAIMLRRIDIVPRAPLILRSFPLIECLVHHKKSHAVAQLIQLRHMRIVAHPDRITAHRLQLFQTAFPDLRPHRGAETSPVMMDAHALYFHRDAVQKESLICVKCNAADTHAAGIRQVLQLLSVCLPPLDTRLQAIERRILAGPQRRMQHLPAAHERLDFPRLQRFGCSDSDLPPTALPDQCVDDRHLYSLPGQILQFILHGKIGGFHADIGRMEKDPVVHWLHRFFDDQTYLSCDAGARKPARVCDIPVIHIHTHDIRMFKGNKLRDIQRVGDIAIRTFSEIVAVAPHAAVFVYPIKDHGDPLPLPCRIRLEPEPVPAHASRQISCPAGILPGKRPRHRPVMGKRHLLPRRIIEPRLPRIWTIPKVKPAALLQNHAFLIHNNIPPLLYLLFPVFESYHFPS